MIQYQPDWLWHSSLQAVFVVGMLHGGQAFAAAPNDIAGRFVDRVYRDESGEHRYQVFVPAGYTPDKRWPVILFLHGAGERGSDGRRQTTVGLGPYVRAHAKTFPFLVVFPQSENVNGRLLEGWLADSPDGKRAIHILDELEREFSIDKHREILTGWSMGGYGTWSIAAAWPERWSAIVPLAGGGEPQWAEKLRNVTVWAFHGANDGAVPPEESRQMIAALKAGGGNPRYSEVVGVAHDIWKAAYSRDDLYSWMLSPRDAGTSVDALLARPSGSGAVATPHLNEPFIPAVVIPRAVYVRLGNEMLEALAYSIPKVVSQDVLAGQVDGIHTSTTAQGRRFNVSFSKISYAAEVARTHLEAYRTDRLSIQLGLRNVTLTIGATYVTGSGRSATTGPIKIVIGHRRPVWLSLAVMPEVQDGKLRLRPVATRFEIPDDNWYVTPPAGVRAHGLGMTRDRVSDSLVEGLYASKERIESEATAVVPSLLEQVEEKLDFSEVKNLVAGVWPLPVYKPRVELRPEQVSTDEDGVSLVFGVAGAAVDPNKAPARPRMVEPVGLSVSSVPRVRSLQVGVAPQMLHALTELLIDADVMRVHVLDIPGKVFEPLSVSKALADAVPDLKRYGDNVEVWTELSLASPVSVVDASTRFPPPLTPRSEAPLRSALVASSASKEAKRSLAGLRSQGDLGHEDEEPATGTFQFEAPNIVVSYRIKTDPDNDDWTPYAAFELQLVQRARPRVLKTSYRARALRLDWSDMAEIEASGRFAPGYEPTTPELDAGKIRDLFARGWRLWTLSRPVSQVNIPDVDFGYSKVRLSQVGWSEPYLYAEFSAPGVRITNGSDEALVYETKGPHTRWGGPYTLEPGRSHDFASSYPLLYRHIRRGPQENDAVEAVARSADRAPSEMYTLPVGSHSEFRVAKTGGAPRLFAAREEVFEMPVAAHLGASGRQ